MAHGDRSVDVFVRKLRAKLQKRSPGWEYIHTHFGIGYRFEPRARRFRSRASPRDSATATDGRRGPDRDASGRHLAASAGLSQASVHTLFTPRGLERNKLPEPIREEKEKTEVIKRSGCSLPAPARCWRSASPPAATTAVPATRRQRLRRHGDASPARSPARARARRRRHRRRGSRGSRTQNPDLTISYDPVGSGGGREQFIAGGVDYAGSDSSLADEELDRRGEELRRCGEPRPGSGLHLADRGHLQPARRRGAAARPRM